VNEINERFFFMSMRQKVRAVFFPYVPSYCMNELSLYISRDLLKVRVAVRFSKYTM